MKKIILLFACLALATPALAAVIGPTNLGFSGYQAHGCHLPRQPVKDDQWAQRNFTHEAENYQRCLNDYIRAAEYDIQRIEEAAYNARRQLRDFEYSLR